MSYISYLLFCHSVARTDAPTLQFVEQQILNIVYDIRVLRLRSDIHSPANVCNPRIGYTEAMMSLGLSKKRATQLVRHALQDANSMPPMDLARKLAAKFFPGGVN